MSPLLRRFDAEDLANFHYGCVLIGDRGSKFFRGSRVDDLSGGREPRRDLRVHDDSANIGGDTFSQWKRHPGRGEYAGKAVDSQRFKTGFFGGGDILSLIHISEPTRRT